MDKELLNMSFAGLMFHFENPDQIKDWMGNLMKYSKDKRQLYEAVMCDGTGTAIELCSTGVKEDEEQSLSILKCLKFISDEYGKIYDPKGEIFSLEEDAHSKLIIE